MNNESEEQSTGPKDPAKHPDAPDDPHPESPQPSPDPLTPNPYPAGDPTPGFDPDTEPIREPEPIPSFPEPIPGGPPDVVI